VGSSQTGLPNFLCGTNAPLDMIACASRRMAHSSSADRVPVFAIGSTGVTGTMKVCGLALM
jgi:hypothetical protein